MKPLSTARLLNPRKIIDAQEHRFGIQAEGMADIFVTGEFRKHAGDVFRKIMILQTPCPQYPTNVQVKEQAGREPKIRAAFEELRIKTIAIQNTIRLLRIDQQSQESFLTRRCICQRLEDKCQIAFA